MIIIEATIIGLFVYFLTVVIYLAMCPEDWKDEPDENEDHYTNDPYDNPPEWKH